MGREQCCAEDVGDSHGDNEASPELKDTKRDLIKILVYHPEHPKPKH